MTPVTSFLTAAMRGTPRSARRKDFNARFNLQATLDGVLARNPGEPEFHQAVHEVFDSLSLVQERHPEYNDMGILTRLCEPDL